MTEKLSEKLKIFTYLPPVLKDGDRIRLRIKGFDNKYLKGYWLVLKAYKGQWFSDYFTGSKHTFSIKIGNPRRCQENKLNQWNHS